MRLVRFFTVGWMGFLVQLAAFVALTRVVHASWLWATAAAAELSIVHNFFWHERWTWKDRTAFPGPSTAAKFARFNLATGIVGVGANLGLVSLFVMALAVPPGVANVLAVAALSVINFVVADRWIYVAVGVTVGSIASPELAAAAPGQKTLDTWNRYTVDAEARFERTGSTQPASDARSWGESVDIESGTIVDWHGVVFIPGITIDCLLDELLHPERAPLQEDVVALRVLSRTPDSLRIYLRLVRKTIVTMTYDTEHEMTFRRLSPALLTARSIATSIREVGGGDHGFLWRMNSYWRYRHVNDGVLVEVESLTLSRHVPNLARPVAGPLITRVARESMMRTLEAMRQRFRSVTP